MKSLAESRAEWKAFHEKAKDGCIFCDGDGVGIKDKNGEIFEPARHGYIGWYGEDLVLASFAAKKCEFRFIRPDGRYYDETRKDEGLYAEEGRIGLWDGRADIPAEYDEIRSWGKDADVYYLRKGSESRYVNHLGEIILAEYRRFDGCDESEPYYLDERKGAKVVISMALAGRRRDAQTCFARGEWVRLDRIRKRDIRHVLSRKGDLRQIPQNEIDAFYFPFVERYSAYTVSSGAKRPVSACLCQLERMIGGLGFDPDWKYYFILSVASRMDVKALDTEEIELFMGGMREDAWTRSYSLGVRIDKTLRKGEVRLFCLRYYEDHLLYWNLEVELEFEAALKTFDESVVMQAYEKLESEFLSVEKRHGRRMRAALEAYHADELRVPSHVPKGKNCREIIDFCEFMVSKGASIAYIVQDVCYEFEKDHDFDESQIDGLLALLRWAVSRGVDVNRIHNGETGLDFLNRKLAFPEIWCDWRLGPRDEISTRQIERIRNCILSLGGKTREEVLRSYRKRPILG